MMIYLAQAATTAPVRVFTSTAGFGPETQISIGVAVSVLIFIVLMVARHLTVLNRINGRLTHLENMSVMISKGMKETWSRKDQKIYSLEVRIKNPTLHVPHVDTEDKEEGG